MADDLDGVSLKSAVPDYDPGPQYRVKELHPDDSSGGQDGYDGFLRRKQKDGGKKQPDGEEGDAEEEENPIPAVPTGVIHDGVVLSQRARLMLDHDIEEQEERTDRKAAKDRLHHVELKA